MLFSIALIFVLVSGLAINAHAANPIARGPITSYDSGTNYYLDARGGTIYKIPHGTYIGDGYSNNSYYVEGVQSSLDALNRTSLSYGDTLSCYPGFIDGLWGTNTRSAVRSFQSYTGLSADGVVGPNTWTKFIYMLNYYG